MKPFTSTINSFLPFLALVICLPFFSLGGNERATVRLDGGEITTSSTLELEDNKYQLMTSYPNWSDLFTNHSAQAKVIFGYNWGDQAVPVNGTVGLNLSITSWDEDGTGTSPAETVNLQLQFSSNAVVSERAVVFIPEYAYKVKVEVTGITGTLTDQFYLEIQTETERYYNLDVSSFLPVSAITSEYLNATDELEIHWPYIEGAEDYELEWTYVNDYKEAPESDIDQPEYYDEDELMFNFRNNATRITTSSNFYRIPILYEKGHIMYRLRGVARTGNHYQTRVVSRWSSENFLPDLNGNYLVDQYDHSYPISSHSGDGLNWQSVSTFAEEGKRKDVVTYNDGSLRARQSATRINATDDILIGETVYDFIGRPAISILPVPSQETKIGFVEGFNVNSVGEPYSWKDFDVDATGTSTVPITASLEGTSSGAANYYSSDNPDLADEKAFLPKSYGFPFSQTVYKPDNSGRIRAQGGVGPVHKIGSGHETKYYYGKPTQIELDRLFGTEVGKAHHYQKNLVIDANEQASVSFVDMQGKTIATALAGNAPSNLGELKDYDVKDTSNTNRWNQPIGEVINITADLLNKGLPTDTDDLLDDNHVSADGKSLKHTSTFVNTHTNNDYVFRYKLDDNEFSPCFTGNPPTAAFCYDIVYDLSLEVRNEAGELVTNATSTSIAYDETIPDIPVAEPIDALCNADGDFDSDDYPTAEEFVAEDLKLGSYTVSKSLSVNEDALNGYLDRYVSDAQANECVEELSDFEYTIPCNTWEEGDCGECITEVNDYYDEVCGTCSSLVDWLINTATPQQVQEYEVAIDNCELLCPGSDQPSLCNITFQQLMADVTPSGQYAKYDVDESDGSFNAEAYPLSVFNPDNQLPGTSSFDWQSIDYHDEFGEVVFEGSSTELTEMTLEEFVSIHWRPSFARDLVVRHPEYCYWDGWCTDVIPDDDDAQLTSDEFDIAMYGISHNGTSFTGVPAGMSINDFLDPIDDSATPTDTKDPFFEDRHFNSSGDDQIELYMSDRIENYADLGGGGNQTISMWKAAAMMVHCPTNLTGTISDLDACLDDPGIYGTPLPSGTNLVNSQEVWNQFRTLYLGEKQRFQEMDMNLYARDNAGSGDFDRCYSGCIGLGEEEFDYAQHGMLESHNSPDPIDDEFQPCYEDSWELYRFKERRFGGSMPFGTEGIDTDPNDAYLDNPNEPIADGVGGYVENVELEADYTVYLSTGQCPLSMDVLTFLSSAAGEAVLTSTSDVTSQSIPGYSADMYEAMSGGSLPITVADNIYDWKAVITNTGSGSDNLKGTFYTVADVAKGYIQLEEPSQPSNFDWDLILGAANIRLTDIVSGVYYFDLQVFYDENQTGAMHPNQLIMLEGSTDIPLDQNCTFEICTPTITAERLQVLMNYMAFHDDLDATRDLNEGNTWSAGNPENLTTGFAYLIGYDLEDYDWEGDVVSDEFTLVNTTTSDEIVLTFATTGSTSVYDDVVIFDNIRPTSTVGDFEIDAYVPDGQGGFEWETWTGDIETTINSVSSDLDVGTCEEPTSLLCQTDEHLNLEHLDDFLNAWVDDGGLDETVTTGSSNDYHAYELPEFTAVLDAGVGSTGEAVIWRTEGVATPTDSREFVIAALFDDGDSQTSNDQDNLATANYTCEFTITAPGCADYNNGTSTGCGAFFSDVVDFEGFEAYGEPFAGGYQQQFSATAVNSTGTAIGNITGVSCYPIANCNPCGDGPNLLSCGEFDYPNGYDPNNSCFDSDYDYTSVCVENDGGTGECEYTVAASGLTIPCPNATNDLWNTGADLSLALNGNMLFTWNDCDASQPFAYKMAYSEDFDGVVHTSDYRIKMKVYDVGSYNEIESAVKVEINGNVVDELILTGSAVVPGEWQEISFVWDPPPSITQSTNCTFEIFVKGIRFALGFDNVELREICSAIPPIPPVSETFEIPDPCDPATFQNNFAAANAQLAYEQYIDGVKEQFRQDYIEQAISGAVEEFTMSYDLKEYHYTLYYYDQAGNLVKTVPPKGVKPLTAAEVATVPSNRNGDPYDSQSTYEVLPEHTMVTAYTYNSLNQLVRQTSPDQRVALDYFDDGNSDIIPDDATFFWYDRLGRIALSMNPEQAIQSNLEYTYTKYDDLGRVVETGVCTDDNIIDARTYTNGQLYSLFEGDFPESLTTDNDLLDPAVVDLQYKEVTITKYDEKLGSGYGVSLTQENLRNRVASILFYEAYTPAYPLNYSNAIHYNYDRHGNVKELTVDLPELYLYEQFFTTSYEYDLVSGNVKRVDAPGFSHKYEYDANNRLTNVYTSTDGIIWEQDAKYFYYDHGPLARTEIGDLKVQGIDHAYTLNGWLKGTNSNTLGYQYDIGADGSTNGVNDIHGNVGSDAFGYSLGYYHDESGYNDYDAANATASAFIANLGSGSDLLNETQNLFNGNISHMINSLPSANTTNPIVGTAYRYDQLNRLIESVTYTNASNNAWETGTAQTPKSQSDYYTSYRYDSNGNLRNLSRNAYGGTNPRKMDRLFYEYQNSGDSEINQTNKLRHVYEKDGTSINSNWVGVDIDHQSADNYEYDRLGNLTVDDQEGIESIEWYNNGKIKSIKRTTSSDADDLEFRYDGLGNRILKIAKKRDNGALLDESNWVYTYYIRDAQGNHLVTLDKNIAKIENQTNECSEELNLKEAIIYGSGRLGVREFEQSDDVNPVTLYRRRFFNYASTNSNGNFIGVTYQPTTVVEPNAPDNLFVQEEYRKQYELKNHLGNVMAVVSDKRKPQGTGSISHYESIVTGTSRYYPFGMIMPEATPSTPPVPANGMSDYRFGFNGMEKDDEVKGNGNSLDFGARIYDPRVGAFLSLDPRMREFAAMSPYIYAADNPIYYVDEDGEGPLPKILAWLAQQTGTVLTVGVSVEIRAGVIVSAGANSGIYLAADPQGNMGLVLNGGAFATLTGTGVSASDENPGAANGGSWYFGGDAGITLDAATRWGKYKHVRNLVGTETSFDIDGGPADVSGIFANGTGSSLNGVEFSAGIGAGAGFGFTTSESVVLAFTQGNLDQIDYVMEAAESMQATEFDRGNTTFMSYSISETENGYSLDILLYGNDSDGNYKEYFRAPAVQFDKKSDQYYSTDEVSGGS